MHDYVIVGAGAAGCVLAARLTEDSDVSVLLLEAGPKDRKLEIRIPAAFSELFRSKIDWAYETEPQAALDGRAVFFPRGRTLGGSTAMNAMMVLRGHRADQDAWGVPGWGWEDIEPAYARSVACFPAEAQRDHSPLTDSFLDAAAVVGLLRRNDLNDPDNEGVGLVPVSQRRGRRFSAADGYLRPAMRRPNLTVVTGARVTRVVVEGGTAVGVAFRVDGREEEARAGREVILAAGAVGSPKLLLLSGIGAREQLAHRGIDVAVDSPGVGRNLRDHVANGILLRTRGASTLRTAASPRHVLNWVARGRGPLSSNVAEAAAFVRSDPDLLAPDLELIFAPVLFEEEGLQRPSEDGVTIASVALQPASVGEVRLRSSDPLVPPSIDPRYLSDEARDDERVLLHGIRLARRIAATEPLARLSRGRDPAGSGGGRRRCATGASPCSFADALPPGRDLPHGRRRRRCRRSRAPCPRRRSIARRRRVRDPAAAPRAHELAHGDGGRAGGGNHSPLGSSGAATWVGAWRSTPPNEPTPRDRRGRATGVRQREPATAHPSRWSSTRPAACMNA